jgi:hypothetical protein
MPALCRTGTAFAHILDKFTSLAMNSRFASECLHESVLFEVRNAGIDVDGLQLSGVSFAAKAADRQWQLSGSPISKFWRPVSGR